MRPPGRDIAVRAAVDGEALRGEASVHAVVPVPEIAFALVLAGLTCLALRLAADGRGWVIPLGVALLAAGCSLMAHSGCSPVALTLLAVGALCVVFELVIFPGLGVYAAAASVGVLLAGLHVTGPPAIHPTFAIPVSAGFGAVTFLAGYRSWRRTRDLPFDRSAGLVGRGAIVLAAPDAAPVAVVAGELWPLEADGGSLRDGQFVRVLHVHEGSLVVQPSRHSPT